jgi:hypothetical protein
MRTYIRTLFNDLFKNNFIVKIFAKIVNFYCSLWFKDPNSVKFEQNMSINEIEKKKILFFQSVTGDQIDCK